MKVLVIDEDKFIRNLFASELAQENMVALVASSGVEGLSIIKESQPDVIILDLILPQMDGFAVLAEIKKMPKSKREHMKIFVFSSLGQTHDRDEALSLGVTEYFAKNNTTIRNVIDAIRLSHSSAS